jgi:hypothetical protein
MARILRDTLLDGALIGGCRSMEKAARDGLPKSVECADTPNTPKFVLDKRLARAQA